MMYTLRDITTENPAAAFVSDVALAWYPSHENNTRLAGSYSWTRQQIGEELPSVTALTRVRESFEWGGAPNRHLWEAIYGHGKSHLALALANFFGQPAGSEPVESVLQALGHAQADVAGLRAFKANKQPYLILRLFGNGADTLAQGVVRGLEKALREYPVTKDHDLGLWFGPAAAGLSAFTPEQEVKGNAFLAKLGGLSMQALRDDLSTRRGQYREHYAQMVEHVIGFRPELGGVLDPKQVVEHVVNELCGPAPRPFAGLLVLFDEFGRFTEDYAREYELLSKNQPLQNFLEGIAGLSGRAAIVAFTQANPEGIAERAMGAKSGRLDEVRKELTRFPDPERKVLVSPLEAVLGDFLRQDVTTWNALLDANPAAEEGLNAALDMVPVLFKARYDTSFWKTKLLRDQLGRECFPLHPLTTALLCTMGIRETVSARPSLGFVQEKYRAYADCSALTETGDLRFIHAIELVAYFKESLAKNDEDWSRYQDALRLVGAEAPQVKKDVLAAMFVLETASLPVGVGLASYEGIIAALTGQSKVEVTNALRELAAEGRIQRDTSRKAYVFWRMGQDGMAAHRELLRATDELVEDPKRFPAALLRQLPNVQQPPVEVSMGNAQDWAACVHLVPGALWSVDYLRKLVKRYQLLPNGQSLDGASRGYVIRPVGYTDEEVTELRKQAPLDFATVMQELDAIYPPPAVLVLPQEPHTGLMRAMAQQQVLDEWNATTRAGFGETAVDQVRHQIGEQRQQEGLRLREEYKKLTDFRVPTTYTPVVGAKFANNPTPSLAEVLRSCYEVAYGWRAPYLADAMSGTSYKTAVWTACDYLTRDKFQDWEANTRGSGGAPARKIFDNVLRASNSTQSWGVVDEGLRVCEPRHTLVQKGWQVLDDAVLINTPPEERVSLREPLLRLMNAPYGFDFFSLGLLFCAWAGRNRRVLHLYNGKTKASVSVAEWLTSEKNFEKVISRWAGEMDLYASRDDPATAQGRIEEIASAWESHSAVHPMAYGVAKAYHSELQHYLNGEPGDADKRLQAKDTALQLKAALELIEGYDKRLNEIRDELSTLTTPTPDTIRTLTKLLAAARTGKPMSSVQAPDAMLQQAVETSVQSALRTATTQVTNQFASPQQNSTLTKCKESAGRLLAIKGYLAAVDAQADMSRVEESLTALEVIQSGLEAEEEDKNFFADVKAAERLESLNALRIKREEIKKYKPSSQKGLQEQLRAKQVLNQRIESTAQWLEKTVIQAGALPDRDTKSMKALVTDARKLSSQLGRRYLDYEGAQPEAASFGQAAKWCELWIKILEALVDLESEVPESNAELQKLLAKYAKFAALEDLSEAQLNYVQEAQRQIEQKYEAHIRAAVTMLEDLIARNNDQEPSATIAQELNIATNSVFLFLPKTEKSNRDKLEKALQKRLDKDEVENIAYRFEQIKDPAQQQRCLERLRKMVDGR